MEKEQENYLKRDRERFESKKANFDLKKIMSEFVIK